MTVIYKRKARTVELNTRTRVIRDAFMKAIEAHKTLQNNVDNSSYANMKERDKEGVFQQIAKKINLGMVGQYIELPQLNEKLDEPAHLMLVRYQDFLYKLLEHVGKSSKDTEDGPITSRFVFLTELLIRLAAIALSTNMDYENDGDLIVKIIESFCENVTATPVLDVKTLANQFSDVQKFNNHFAIQHPEKLQSITEIVRIIKILHAPESAFALTTEYLKQSKYIIMRQSVATIEANKSNILSKALSVFTSLKPQDYDENRIENTYHALLENTNRESLSEFTQEKLNKLENLYQHTSWLYNHLSKIDISRVATGWVLIITDELNIHELSNLVESHWAIMQRVKMEPDDPVLKSKGMILRQRNAVSMETLRKPVMESLKNLYRLSDKNTRQALRELISGASMQIKISRDAVPIEFKAIVANNNNNIEYTVQQNAHSNMDHGLPFFRDENHTVDDDLEPDVDINVLSQNQEMAPLVESKNRSYDSSDYSDASPSQSWNPVVGFLDTVLYGFPCRDVKKNEEKLKSAAKIGNAAIIKNLLKEGVDPNGRGMPSSLCSIYQSFFDKTALMVACQEGKFNCVKALVDGGANLYLKDAYGYTAHKYAKENDHTAILNYLNDKMCDEPSSSVTISGLRYREPSCF